MVERASGPRRLSERRARPMIRGHPFTPTSTPMSEKTLFTRIIEGEIPGDIVYQDEHVVAIRDINPAAPVHVLVIPRRPVASLAELEEADLDLAGRLMLATAEIARREGLTSGYRVVVNTGRDGGQTVPHLHLHLLGGKTFSEGSMRG
jgi:histidine triad (HIT) family protein